MNSRRFAKRQITFFKTLPDVKWFNPEDVDLAKVLEDLKMDEWEESLPETLYNV